MLRAKSVRSHRLLSAASKSCRDYRRALVEILEDRVLLSNAPFVVNTFADPTTWEPNVLSLRHAIGNAGITPGDDTIIVPAGVYTLTQGDLYIADKTGKLTIESTGGQATVIASSGKEVFFFDPGAPVAISGFNLFGDPSAAGRVGAVGMRANRGTTTLSLTNCTVNDPGILASGYYGTIALNLDGCTLANTNSSNAAISTSGWGVNETFNITNCAFQDNLGTGIAINDVNAGSTVTMNISDSTFQNTSDAIHGGSGIRNFADYSTVAFDLSNCTFHEDASVNGSQGGRAIYSSVYASRLALDVSACTMTGPGAGSTSTGGGIGIDATDGSIATIDITDSTISGNSSTAGGGIFNYGGTVSLTDCTISGNSVSHSIDIFNGGGGIYNIAGTLSVTDCTISGNSANADGGGIFNQGTLSVTNSTISGNSAEGAGGGIYNAGTVSITGYNAGTMSLTDSTISGNSANADGGGIFNQGTLSVADSTIVANRADSDGTGGAGEIGGGLGGDAANVTLNNTIIAGNLRGTGITVDDISWQSGTIAGASHNLIGDAGTSGGIANSINGDIVGVSDLTTVLVDVNHDGKIDSNDLIDMGGRSQTYILAAGSPAINAGDNSLAVDANGDPLQFDQRGAPFARIVGGTVDIGAFEAQPIQLVVDTTTDVDNGNFSAGDLSLREAIELADLNPGADTISFDAALAGQKILLNGSELPAITDDLTITGLGADQLTIDAQGQSRIFEIESGNIQLSGLTLTSGTTSSRQGGGAIFNDGILSITGSMITGNSSFYFGGGISNGGTVNLSDSTISGNSDRYGYGFGGGGGIFNDGILSVTDSMITGNSASYLGGGIYNYGGTMTITGSTISGNSVSDGFGFGGGGGISNYHGTLSITGSTISGNSAHGNGGVGGGISNDGGTMTITDSTISGNSVSYSYGFGGGISNGGTVNLSDSTISGNSASHGGGISNGGTLNVTGSTISGNSAHYDGGGIINYGTLSVTGTTISGNSTHFLDGGGIYNYGMLSATGSTISGNSARYGGGIADYYGTLSVTDSTISGNSASHGGGIFAKRALRVSDSTISGNSASYDGGGIYNDAYGTLITGSTVSGNSASQGGGGIFNSQGTLFLTNSTLVANRADMYDYGSRFVGGGLGGDASGVTLNNTIVAGNFSGTGDLADDISWSSGTIAAASHNLIGDAATSGGIANGVDGNIVGVSDLTTVLVDVNHDGKIDASDLADNGGPTKTYALAPGSPAINAGDDSLVPAGITTDQRGPGYNRFVGTVDIGAVEEQNHSPTVSDLTVKTDENLPFVLSLQVFDGAYADAENDPLAAVRVDSLPADGVLLLDGQAVTAGEVVSRADLSSFVYQPGHNYSGNDSFAFSASDGISFAERDATLTVDVLTPQQAVEELAANLNGLNLGQNVETSLGAKLDAADALLGENANDTAVLAHLDAFKKDVNHWAEQGLIDASAQNELLAAAGLIEQSILWGAV